MNHSSEFNRPKYDVFIAYSLSPNYSTASDAIKQDSYSKAYRVFNEVKSLGYTPFMHSPDEVKTRFKETPQIAKQCSLFVLVVDFTLLKKCNTNGKLEETTWSYNELHGFLSQPCIDEKIAIAQKYCQAYVFDGISDERAMKLHDALDGNTPIRNKEKLKEWLDERILNQKKETIRDDSKTETGWGRDAAGLFMELAEGPAIPSDSEISFYKSYLKKVSNRNADAKILIMGSTKSFYEMAKNDFAVTVVDSSSEYVKTIFKKTDLANPRLKIIISDWAEMGKALRNEKFDIVIGDLALGNISTNKIEDITKLISRLLKKDGYWLGKNWFRFEQLESVTKQELLDEAKNMLSADDQDIFFQNMVYKIVMFCSNNGKMTLDFARLNVMVQSIADELSVDTFTKEKIMQSFNRFLVLHDKGISFKIFDIKMIVSLAYKHGLVLLETGYGNDAYSSDFPLLVFQNQSLNDGLTKSMLKKTCDSLTKFIPSKADYLYYQQWIQEMPSQYYVVRLSKMAGMKNPAAWAKHSETIIKDISEAIVLKVNGSLNCEIVDLKSENMGTEINHIHQAVPLSHEDQKKIIQTYQLAVLLYLSSALPSSKKDNDLYNLVSQRLENSNIKAPLHCWEPFSAPWLTAKVCASAYYSREERKEHDQSSLFDDIYKSATVSLITSYKSDYQHNWECNVGSKLDTCALCVEAILCYYDELNDSDKDQAVEVFYDILDHYVLGDNVYETIAIHPLGYYAIERLPTDKSSIEEMPLSKEPYQKSILGTIAFFSALVRIIAFFKNDISLLAKKRNLTPSTANNELDWCRKVIMHKLVYFWHLFSSNSQIDQIISVINITDTCMIPQILYSLIQVFND